MAEQFIDRTINALSESMADRLQEKESNITEAEINQAARNFIEFIRIFRVMDVEQRATLTEMHSQEII